MNLKELEEKGLIRKSRIERDEIEGSLAMADRFLQRAKSNMEMSFFDVAFLLAYNSMFHAARALLFKMDYKERGHFAMIAALKELYPTDPELLGYLDVIDSYRTSRHAIQYSGELGSELDSAEAIRDAGKFLAYVKLYIKSKS